MIEESQFAVIDTRWRLLLPAKFVPQFGGHPESVIIASAGDGCISIYPYPEGRDYLPPDLECSEVAVRRGKKEKPPRITIPGWLRCSPSFHFGRTVKVVWKGDHMEIWPRPGKGNELGRRASRPSSNF